MHSNSRANLFLGYKLPSYIITNESVGFSLNIGIDIERNHFSIFSLSNHSVGSLVFALDFSFRFPFLLLLQVVYRFRVEGRGNHGTAITWLFKNRCARAQ